jgi:hypothetical protein
MVVGTSVAGVLLLTVADSSLRFAYTAAASESDRWLGLMLRSAVQVFVAAIMAAGAKRSPVGKRDTLPVLCMVVRHIL